MFKNYESKPVTRKAYRIKSADEIVQIPQKKECVVYVNGHDDFKGINFVAHEPVNVGDFIVYLNQDDIYHCNAKVFAERNIIE